MPEMQLVYTHDFILKVSIDSHDKDFMNIDYEKIHLAVIDAMKCFEYEPDGNYELIETRHCDTCMCVECMG
jgi:hypothetical protein